ncbi:hypothetical protein [Streptomyces roseoverticillatus]|uniref:Uncharacterized protein n=1 Tax=Streptomyces roseoverticillatus TaxID=66429 RepID=A0ABV3J567_9ACTN
MLHGLRGHCNSPIAGHCTTDPDGQLSLRGGLLPRRIGVRPRPHPGRERQ